MRSLPVKTGLLIAGCLLWSATQAYSDSGGGLNVKVSQGALKGFAKDGVENFFGIPYAAAPVGELRWKDPQPVKPWEGSRAASAYGPNCPQGSTLDSVRTTNEDCLFLNVQRPAGAKEGARIPVMVLIHGGGWQTGSGGIENLNALVEKNNIIGVTMNYRLGLLGALSHPGLADAEGDVGNYSLKDQQAALKWVKENIAAFGGDPAQVTLGGESAGAGSTCQLLAASSADGLYAQAFMMSTRCDAVPMAEALKQGEDVAKSLGCDGDGAAACLRGLSVDALIDSKKQVRLPVSGTRFLPKSGWDRIVERTFPKVPMLVGGTKDEGRTLISDWANRSVPTFTQDSYENYVRDNFGTNADAVLAVYPWPENPDRYSGTYLVAELNMAKRGGKGDLNQCNTGKITELLAGQGSPVWSYEFAPSDGPGWFEVPGYVSGTGHATDLPYLIPDRGNFANNAKAFGAKHKALSEAMLEYWGSFVRTGKPASGHGPEWAPYIPGEGPVLALREGDRTMALPTLAIRSEHHCDFWDDLNR